MVELENEIGTLTTVTGADISPTLEHATIIISVYPIAKTSEVMEKIRKHIYAIQQALNKRLMMRPVPKIRFEIDQTEERANQITDLLKKVN